MTEQIVQGRRDDAIERQPRGTAFVFAVLVLVLAIQIMLLVLLVLRIELAGDNPVAVADTLSGADESAALCAFVTLVLGAVCARRDNGRVRRLFQ